MYLVPPRLVLGVNVHTKERLPEPQGHRPERFGAVKSRNVSRDPTGPRGTLRNGKMAELRLESGILGIPGPVVRFPFVVTASTVVARI